MESKGLKKKELLTILGQTSYNRSMYRCPSCGTTRFPGDEALDVVNTTRSPGVRRMMSRAGSNRTFKEAKEDLNIYAGITVSAKDVERVAEATGKEVEAWQKYINLQILKKQQKPRQLPLLSLCCISPMTARCADGTVGNRGQKGKTA